jgi:hypothetical protein
VLSRAYEVAGFKRLHRLNDVPPANRQSAGAFDGGARDLQGLHLCELRLDRSPSPADLGVLP